jgi:hypothetical protein
MMRYRITTPTGHSTTAELNEAAVLDYLARGWQLEVLGLSRISQRVRAVREVAELWARDGLSGADMERAKALKTEWQISLAEMNGV